MSTDGQAHSPATSPRVARQLATLALIGLCVALFAWVLSHAELGAVRRVVARAGPRLALGLVPFGVMLALDALGWQRVFWLVGRRVPFRALLATRVSSEAILLTLPCGPAAVEALKPAMLESAAAVPPAATLATLPACKVMLMSTQSAYLLLGVAFARDDLADASRALLGARPVLAVAMLVGAFALAAAALMLRGALSSGAAFGRARRALGRIPIPPLRRWLIARERAFERADEGLAQLWAAPTRMLLFAGLPFLLSWLCQATDTWLMLRLLGAHPAPSSVLCLDASISILRVVAVLAPGGLGVTDGGYLAALPAFHLVDDPSMAVAFVVANRAKEAVWIMAGYTLALFGRARRHARAPHADAVLPARVVPEAAS